MFKVKEIKKKKENSVKEVKNQKFCTFFWGFYAFSINKTDVISFTLWKIKRWSQEKCVMHVGKMVLKEIRMELKC